MSLINSFDIKDGRNIDAFSRLRVSNPVYQFDSQFTYDLQSLLFEQITLNSGASIVHDTINRIAVMTFSSTPTGGKAIMQSYEWFKYQAGRGQLMFTTFDFNEGVPDVIKFAELGDGINAYGFRMNGLIPEFYILSGTQNGNEIAPQSSWNQDKLDGLGKSGYSLDISKEQILVLDFQALYTGRVRMGFDIGGNIVYCHEFLHSNMVEHPYIQNASLPIRVGMTCTGTVSTTMSFNCSAVISEGGSFEDIGGYNFSVEGNVTAGNGADTHILSLRPKTTFNGITNRYKFILDSLEFLVTGNSSILWKLCLGQLISGTTTYINANTTYSGFEYNTLGTISGSPSIVIAQGYVASAATSKGAFSNKIANKYPITLSSANLVRSLGTLSVLVQGIGGGSATRCVANYREIR